MGSFELGLGASSWLALRIGAQAPQGIWQSPNSPSASPYTLHSRCPQ
jgi:hypothetical protein